MSHDILRKGRRAFLAAIPAIPFVRLRAGGNARSQSGGQPVRATALPESSYPGTQFYDEQEYREVSDVLESRTLFRWYGPKTPRKVAQFEEEFARFMGAKYALAVTSGTAALHCALTALDVGPGDEVILPAWTWYSCYNAVLLTGALPVFAEVDESFNIDPNDIDKKITPRTKAIMVVHLYGCPADMDGILAVARKHKVRILEDAAQSVGAQYRGRRLGSIGDIGIYSFQISKTITAGEGGAVVTNDPLLFERATRFHDLGILRPGHETALGKAGMAFFVGTNYRMNEMTGGVMRAQLRKLETLIGLCRRNLRSVKEQAGNLAGLKLRRSPDPDGEIGLVVYPILKTKEQRDKYVQALRAENIAASAPPGSPFLPAVPYIEKKIAPHAAWPSFNSPRGQAMRYGVECCPRTLDLRNRAVYIPIGPKYTAADTKDIAAAIRKVHGALS
ncbi:MAG: DegT/DnrJ/EryC1/StrS family aminotransferase [Acidobacteriota bacterium]